MAGPTHTNFKITSFEVDHNLLYTIQKLKGENTEQILGYLWETVGTVIYNTLKKTRARQMNERIKTFYRKGDIPMQIEVWSYYYSRMDQDGPGQAYPMQVKVVFPRKTIRLNVQQMADIANEAMEVNIGLSDSISRLEDIKKPERKIPKRLRGLV